MNLDGINVTLPIQLLFKIMEKANDTNIIRKQIKTYLDNESFPDREIVALICGVDMEEKKDGETGVISNKRM